MSESILPPQTTPSTTTDKIAVGVGASEGIFDRVYQVLTGERARKDALKQAQITRDREDNAIQRRVADMEAAGLHPTLAAGSPASASVQSPIPQPHQKTSSPGIMSNALIGAQLQNIQAQTAMTMAESRRIQAETELLPRRYNMDAARTRSDISRNDWNNQELYQRAENLFQDTQYKQIISDIARQTGLKHAQLENIILSVTDDKLRAETSNLSERTRYSRDEQSAESRRRRVDLMMSADAHQATAQAISNQIARESGHQSNGGIENAVARIIGALIRKK